MTTMTYSQLFNQALELLDEQGAEEAYELVKQEWQNVELSLIHI